MLNLVSLVHCCGGIRWCAAVVSASHKQSHTAGGGMPVIVAAIVVTSRQGMIDRLRRARARLGGVGEFRRLRCR